MSSERYYRNVQEIEQVSTVDAANELLKRGWEILKIVEMQRDEIAKLAGDAQAVARVTLLVFLMGRVG